MAVDKLVDSTQLDTDLTSVANAIRAKSGGSGQLAFPAGFVSEIGNISGGGEEVYYGERGHCYVKDVVSPATNHTAAYYLCPYLETFYAPNATSIGVETIYNCENVKSVRLPQISSAPQYMIRQQGASYNKLEEVIVGSIGYPITSFYNGRWRYGSHAMVLNVTIYVDAATIANIPSAVTNYANGDNNYAPSGSVVNIIYRNSTTGEVITS